MLVMTKSVVSTPAHLDIKVRVAQGLSREGWSITKNLMTEITLLTFGFFTFVPIIQVWIHIKFQNKFHYFLITFHFFLQEFCLFATVGLLSDFFLQITFFATVLSVDIQRLEVSIKSCLRISTCSLITLEFVITNGLALSLRNLSQGYKQQFPLSIQTYWLDVF